MKFVLQSKLLLVTTLLLSFMLISCDDNDDVTLPLHVKFTNASASVGESDTDPLTVSIHLAGPIPTSDITVNFEISDGNAVQGEDFQMSATGAVTIPSGSNFATFEISMIDNFVEDGTKSLVLSLTGTSDGTRIAGPGGPDGPGLAGKTFSITINDDDCSPNIAGTYMVTTDGCTGDGAGGCGGDYAGVTNEITVTREGAGVYTFSDLTGGLYKNGYGDSDNPGTVEDNCGVLSITEQPDTVYGGDAFTGTGSINEDGTLTIEWSNNYGDAGTSTFVIQ